MYTNKKVTCFLFGIKPYLDGNVCPPILHNNKTVEICTMPSSVIFSALRSCIFKHFKCELHTDDQSFEGLLPLTNSYFFVLKQPYLPYQ